MAAQAISITQQTYMFVTMYLFSSILFSDLITCSVVSSSKIVAGL